MIKIPQGRPTILTKAKIDKLAEIILRSNYIETACQAVGLSQKRSVFYDAINKAESILLVIDEMVVDDLQQHFEKVLSNKKNDVLFDAAVIDAHGFTVYEILCLYLHYRVKKCEAESEINDLEVINRAAVIQWQAAAWKLERRHSQKWAEKNSNSVTIAIGIQTRNELQEALNKPDSNSVTIVSEVKELPVGGS